MTGGETKANVSAWTIDSLKEHIAAVVAAVYQWATERFTAHETLHNERFAAQEKAIKLAVEAVENESLQREKAIEKSEANTRERLAGVEAVVGRLADQVSVLMPRSEAEQRIGQNADKLTEQAARSMPRDEGLQRANANAEKITDLSNQMNTAVAQINSRLDLNAGSSAGADKYRATLFALLAAAATAVGLAFALFGRN